MIQTAMEYVMMLIRVQVLWIIVEYVDGDGSSCIAWTINTGNFYYSPSSLTIDIGDTVEQINDSGFHDVNGMISTITNLSFNNPEDFYISSRTPYYWKLHI